MRILPILVASKEVLLKVYLFFPLVFVFGFVFVFVLLPILVAGEEVSVLVLSPDEGSVNLGEVFGQAEA